MTDQTAKPADVRLFVRTEASRYSYGENYLHVTAQPYVLAPDRYSTPPGKMTLTDPDSYSLDGVTEAQRALKDLKISAQMDGRGGPLYGYRLEYDLARASLPEIDRVLSTFRRLDRKMTALADRFGYPRDLATFLAYLAQAIMPKQSHPFLRPLDGQDDYEGTGYRSMNAEGLRYWLDHVCREWREKNGVPELAQD